jgi:hypothetical protein
MTAESYRQIMEQHMLPAAKEKMAPGWLFMQDGDPKHTSQLMMGRKRRLPGGRFLRLPGWFSLNNVRVLRWPAYSPDLNPIEHCWSWIKRQLRGRRFRNGDECWEAVQQAWYSIPVDFLMKIVDSMPRRLAHVRLARGGPTKY